MTIEISTRRKFFDTATEALFACVEWETSTEGHFTYLVTYVDQSPYNAPSGYVARVRGQNDSAFAYLIKVDSKPES